MKKRRGIALITVLIIAVVLMMLLGSFVRIQQQNFSLIKNDDNFVAATEAARSAFDYSLFRLERNHYFGKSAFDANKDISLEPHLEIKEVKGTFRLEGKVKQTGAEFVIVIRNNIDGKTPVDGVAKGHCRLLITGKRGGAKVRREAMMTTAPLFDSGVIASKDIKIDAESLTISSRDPLRNRVRSKGAIHVPGISRFHFNPAEAATERGVLWAKDGIMMGSQSLSTENAINQVSSATGGRFMPKADTWFDIHDLQLNEVRSSKRNVSVKSGILVFGRREVAYLGDNGIETANVPVVERRDWAVDDDGNVTGGNVRELWYMPKALPADRASWQINVWGDVPEEGMHAQFEPTFQLDKGVSVHFNSLDPDLGNAAGPPQVVINSDVNLEVEGDFGIASFDHKFWPSVVFQDPETKATETDIHTGETISGSITTKARDGKPGSIYIEGRIDGNGKLLAQGDVTIRNTYARVDSDKKSDLSVYAGGKVTIRPQKAKWLDGQTVVNQQEEGTTAFRGLVYAKEDVFIEADKNMDLSVEEKADIHIEGAVVSRTGSVIVSKARHVTFTYNPEFLDHILDPDRETRVRLERVVWKEI